MIDSHAHMAAVEFDSDRSAVIERMLGAGVQGWVEIGTSLDDSRASIDLAHNYGNCYATVGVHPNGIDGLTETDWTQLAQLAQDPRVVAIGEVGLDFFRGGSAAHQVDALKKFIALAEKNNLPLVFHVRDGQEINAHDQLINLLQTYQGASMPAGVIHTFSGSADQAARYIELGMYLSFSGVITFKNAGQVIEAAKAAPLDRILIETDCPFLTPDPHRGKRNEPAFVAFVARKLAEIRGLDKEEIGQLTHQNTERLFRCQW